MLKKLIATGASAAILLSATVPVFAFPGTFIVNKAKVKNVTITKADSGDNSINAGDDVKGGKIKTGLAVAYGQVDNLVNANMVDGCNCGSTTVINKAKVKNVTITKADSGDNSINAGDDVKGGKIKTGDAGADSIVTNVVNTNVVSDTP